LCHYEEELGNDDLEENDVELPDMLKKEVDKVLRLSKHGESQGEDGLTGKMLRWG